MSEIETIREEIAALHDDVKQLLSIMSEVFIPAAQVTKTKRLNENTITRNDKIEKYNEIGKCRLLISLSVGSDG